MTAPNFSPEQMQWLASQGLLGQQPQQQQRPVMAQPSQFQQPFQQQPQQRPQQPQQQQPVDVLSQRIQAGPGVPGALVGKTVQEVVGALTRVAGQLQQVQQGQPNPQLPQQPQGAAQQAQNILNAGQPQQQLAPAAITMESIQQAMRQTIAEQQLPSVIMQVEQSVAQQVPIYSRDKGIRDRVQEIIGQLPAEQQALRGTWDYALSMAVGERTLASQQQGMPGFVAPTTPGNAAWNPPGQQQASQQQQPFQSDRSLQLPQSTFVEAPSNNSFAAMNQQRPPITQVEAGMAEKFGLDPSAVAKYNTENFGGFV